MPELPEVETVRRGLAPTLLGARLVRVETRRANLRTPFPQDFSARLEGRKILRLDRRAKYLLADIEGGETLVAHLGMSGSFRIEGEPPPGGFHFDRGKDPKHDHVVFHLEKAQVIYNDPRRFGFMTLCATDRLDTLPFFKKLGVEPLSNAFSAVTLARLFAGRATSLKAALLDQSAIAGLGNIYVCEALFRAKLSPERAANCLADAAGRPSMAAEKLAIAIRNVLEEAIQAGGSSLRDHRQADGSLGYFQHNFAVYDREGELCATPGCGGVVARKIQNGRSSFFCPKCQS